MSTLRHRLDAIATHHGLAAIGVASAEPFAQARSAIEQRVATGRNGSLRFTFAAPDVSTDLRASFPWANRVIAASRSYLPDAGSPEPAQGHGVVARFAVDDPYQPLRRALSEIATMLEKAGHRAEVLVDDNRLVDRAAALRAGIAWQGKSTMMLDPRHGPWIVLGSVVTDAELAVDREMARTCGTCDSCIPACPTGAIVEPGVLDARLCLAAWAQTAGIIPIELRAAMGDRLYGCDDCLDACPPGHRLLESSAASNGAVDLLDLLATADEALRDRYNHFYLPKHDPDVLRRNALVILGNQCEPSSIGLLAGYLGHQSQVLRSHAAWALGRIDDARARSALRLAERNETEPAVLREIETALGGTPRSGLSGATSS